jgi:hypothetical protein
LYSSWCFTSPEISTNGNDNGNFQWVVNGIARIRCKLATLLIKFKTSDGSAISICREWQQVMKCNGLYIIMLPFRNAYKGY